jgi:hypothetical protein
MVGQNVATSIKHDREQYSDAGFKQTHDVTVDESRQKRNERNN